MHLRRVVASCDLIKRFKPEERQRRTTAVRHVLPGSVSCVSALGAPLCGSAILAPKMQLAQRLRASHCNRASVSRWHAPVFMLSRAFSHSAVLAMSASRSAWQSAVPPSLPTVAVQPASTCAACVSKVTHASKPDLFASYAAWRSDLCRMLRCKSASQRSRPSTNTARSLLANFVTSSSPLSKAGAVDKAESSPTSRRTSTSLLLTRRSPTLRHNSVVPRRSIPIRLGRAEIANNEVSSSSASSKSNPTSRVSQDSATTPRGSPTATKTKENG
mmetsp:Transcript_17236/g.46657  ORF Transcript_17236/g.46657 Transcript_17236/m.46657 type:complete len:273 (-) Transcript_17236:59-877(-)